MRTVKTLIRLGRCPGWSESSLGAQSFYWFFLEAQDIRHKLKFCLFDLYLPTHYFCPLPESFYFSFRFLFYFILFFILICYIYFFLFFLFFFECLWYLVSIKFNSIGGRVEKVQSSHPIVFWNSPHLKWNDVMKKTKRHKVEKLGWY